MCFAKARKELEEQGHAGWESAADVRILGPFPERSEASALQQKRFELLRRVN